MIKKVYAKAKRFHLANPDSYRDGIASSSIYYKIFKQMKQLFFFLFCSLISGAIVAQTNEYTKAEDSDPEATAILDKIKKKYKTLNTIEAKFSLEMKFPEEPAIIQGGTVAKAGKKYYMNTESYSAICDGQSVWFILKDNKEVQINTMPEEGETDELLTPESMFTFYEKEDYVYILANQFMENNIPVQQIEFKPLDYDSEYAKLRLTYNKNNLDIVRIKTFSKDGTTFTLNINEINANKNLEDRLFTFDASKYPDFHIEDLR